MNPFQIINFIRPGKYSVNISFFSMLILELLVLFCLVKVNVFPQSLCIETIKTNQIVSHSTRNLLVAPTTPDIQVSHFTPGSQRNAKVATLNDGKYVIVWVSDATAVSTIQGRMYYPFGVAYTNEFTVNDNTLLSLSDPDITSTKDGGFSVTWQDMGGSIFAKFYNAYGQNITSSFDVEPTNGDFKSTPSIASLRDGRVMIVWATAGFANTINGKLYQANGSAIGNALQLSALSPSSLTLPKVCGLSSGGIVITWQKDFGGDSDVFLKVYDNELNVLLSEDSIDPHLPNDKGEPCVTCLSNGDWAIAYRNISNKQILVRMYDQNRNKKGIEFAVQGLYPPDTPFAMTSTNDGDLVFTWEFFNGGDYDIYHSVYSTTQAALQAPIRVTLSATSDQRTPAIAPFFGGYIIVWHALLSGSSADYIYHRRYSNYRSESCSSDLDCFGNFTICNQAKKKYCVACITNLDCRNPNAPICSTNSSLCIICQEAENPDPMICPLTNNGNNISNRGEVIDGIKFTVAEKLIPILLVIPMFASGVDPTLLWGFIHLMQMFYYLLFLNVEYPRNLQIFLSIFSLARPNFIPNPFASLVGQEEGRAQSSPPHFYYHEFSGLLLESVGSDLALILFSIFFYLIGKIWRIIAPHKINEAIVKFYEWSGFLRLWITAYPDLMFGALLQMYSLNFDNSLYSINSILGILILVCNIGFPLLVYFIIKRASQTRLNLGKYQAITEDFDMAQKSKRYFMINVITKKLALAVIIVILYYYPLFQVIFPWLLVFLHLIMVIYISPHHKKSLNVMDIVIESNFFSIHSLITVIAYDKYVNFLDKNKKEMVGWLIIASCLCVILLQLILIIREQYEAIVNLCRKSQKARVIRPMRVQKRVPKSHLEPPEKEAFKKINRRRKTLYINSATNLDTESKPLGNP